RDDLFLQLLVFALLRGRERIRFQAQLDILLLQAAQALVFARHRVEGLEHLRLQLGLDRGERERILELVLLHVRFGGGFGRILLLAVPVRGGLRLERRRGRRRARRRSLAREIAVLRRRRAVGIRGRHVVR